MTLPTLNGMLKFLLHLQKMAFIQQLLVLVLRLLEMLLQELILGEKNTIEMLQIQFTEFVM